MVDSLPEMNAGGQAIASVWLQAWWRDAGVCLSPS